MANIIFDIDGTLRNFESEPQFDPELKKFLTISKEKHKNHIVTGRTYVNIQNFLKELNINEDIFESICCEDGHICYRNKTGRLLIDPTERKQLEDVKKIVERILPKSEDISLPETHLVAEVAIVLQITGRGTVFIEELKKQISTNNLDRIKVVKLTHNRVSVAAKGINKCTAVDINKLDLSGAYYFCDEKNDLELAIKVLENKGQVICPSNAIPELKKIASYVSQKPYSFGVVDFLRQIL